MDTNNRMIILEGQIIDLIAAISTKLRFNKKICLEEEGSCQSFCPYKNESSLIEDSPSNAIDLNEE
ncbi:hypothetical protein ACK8P5_12535 [Paenibacillus sp. EC2-1]|uniref:hypothetical protein n=1 Tax=Paenibacillus sp. EC2-1 TaxID=3388665 RepID=UPI003BEEBAE0